MRGRILIFICFFVAVFSVNLLGAQSPFVSIKLKNGISFELPRNWVVIDLNTKTTLEASVAARFPIDVNSTLPFAANLYNSKKQTIGMINVRVYPDIEIYQHEVLNLTAVEISEINNVLQENIMEGVVSSGSTLTDWYGTEKIKIRDKVYLLSKYRRRSGINPNNFFRVSLVRLLHGRHSFTLTLSYEEKEQYLLDPIIEYIMNSIRSI